MLPRAGGLLDQEEDDIRRLICIYDHLEEWRDLELKRQTPQEPQADRPRGTRVMQ
jgi:hypothetical protein